MDQVAGDSESVSVINSWAGPFLITAMVNEQPPVTLCHTMPMLSCRLTLLALWTTAWSSRGESVIPQHLEECYSRSAPASLPLTAGTLTDLVRKASFSPFSPVSLAQQTSDILTWFSVEGLEREPHAEYRGRDMIPFRRSGFQAMKQDLLFEKLIQVSGKPFEGAPTLLSSAEKCSLHWMVSAAVEPWPRGDEAQVCPNADQQLSGWSACPVEGGVVRSGWGSVGGGRLLGGLLAALAPQSAPLAQLLPDAPSSEAIDNLWAATLAGDLAEAAVLQWAGYDGDVGIGLRGKWNDSYVPTKYYFDDIQQQVIDKHMWQITDAEILGGIDGLLIGNMAVELRRTMPDLRLPQLLDMYYSHTRQWEGQYHACRRKASFVNFIRDKKNVLITQTQNFAKLLSTKATNYFTNATIIDGRCVKAVEKFLRYYSVLLETEACPEPLANSPMLNVNLIMDATWTPYTNLQFLMQFTQDNDIGFHGGRIVTINEDSKNVLVHYADSPSALYQKINISHDYQDSVSLVYRRAFVTLKNIVEESNRRENDLSEARRSTQDVVVVMGYSSTISDKDLELCKQLLTAIKMQNPALRMVYWSSHAGAPSFVRLTFVPRAHTDAIIATDNDALPQLLTKLRYTLSQSPRNLKPAYCKMDFRRWPESRYDELITPGDTIAYWIHPDYLCGSQDIVKISFKNSEQGELWACMSRSAEERGQCLAVGAGQEATHSLPRPCLRADGPRPLWQWHPQCLPVHFTVTATRSHNKCSGYECRYPDQLKFSIIVQDLQCVRVNTDTCAGSYNPSRARLTHVFVCSLSILLINIQFIFNYIVDSSCIGFNRHL